MTGQMPAALRTASWIEPDEPVVPPAGRRPAYQLRHEFALPGPVRAATAWATAHGIYELFVNGVRAGDAELTPGFTAYRRRLQVQAYDVGGLLAEGANAVEFLLSDGWFRGRHGFQRAADGFGTRVAALLALEVCLADGATATITTGPEWRSRPSRIIAADLMDGQDVDLRRPEPGMVDLAAPGWRPAHPVDGGRYADRDRLVPGIDPPVRRIQELAPVSIQQVRAVHWFPAPSEAPGAGSSTAPQEAGSSAPPDGPGAESTALQEAGSSAPSDGPGARTSTVVDFGQNINGWIRLRRLGPAGTTLRIVHGEHLDHRGRVDTGHLRAPDLAHGGLLPAGQVDTVVSAGRAGEWFEPRHTTHGFRYAEIEGLAEPLSAADVSAVVVHTDLAEAGRFACSDPRLEALHRAAVWSFRGNACDIPTDCPQRERSGFSGDWQIYVATAALTHDVAAFSDKWLRDLAADQWPDGRIPTVAPNPAGAGPSGNPFLDAMEGSAGWGDAAVFVPWELWRAYGDLALLDRQYPAMIAWVRYAADAAAGRRHPGRAAARPHPAPHERYLWDTGGHFGEWLEPGATPGLDPGTDQGIVATAYLARSARLLGRMAALLGRADDAARYADLAAAVTDAWQREYLDPAGDIAVPTQANHVRALAFDLIPERLRPTVADRLAALIAGNGHRLGTGFLTTGLLLPVLADNGHLDVAYRVLLGTGIPSWLEMIARGATTIWERWDGIGDDGAHGSLNHYSKGAVVSFLYTHVAGLRLLDDPGPESAGYRRFVVEPRPGGDLEWAEAEHHSAYGRARSAWRRRGDVLEVSVDVPPGTRAEVRLPDGQRAAAGPGSHAFVSGYAPTML